MTSRHKDRGDMTVNQQNAAEASESRVTAALERRPAVAIPEGFAVRVMSRLPEKQPTARRFSAGRAIAYVFAALIALALLLLTMLNPAALDPAALGAGKSFAFAVEMLLVAELLAVGFWLGMRRDA